MIVECYSSLENVISIFSAKYDCFAILPLYTPQNPFASQKTKVRFANHSAADVPNGKIKDTH